jgi:hypothetical protein
MVGDDYRPFAGDLERYPRLKPVLSKHVINWNIIAQQYDEVIKYATALLLVRPVPCAFFLKVITHYVLFF